MGPIRIAIRSSAIAAGALSLWLTTAKAEGPSPAPGPPTKETRAVVDTATLAQALNALGFDAGDGSSGMTDQLRRAISAFQDDSYLPTTGAADEKTAALIARYARALQDHPSPSGALSGIGRISVRLGNGASGRGSGFLAGDRCTVVFSAHTLSSLDTQAQLTYSLGPRTAQSYPAYSFVAEVIPAAMGLALNEEDEIVSRPDVDWMVGRLSPCAPSEYSPLEVSASFPGHAETIRNVFVTGYPGDADAAHITVLACAFAPGDPVDQNCALRGMSGGPVFEAPPSASAASSVVAINTGFVAAGGERYESFTPAPAFYIAVENAVSDDRLTSSREKAEVTAALVRLGFLSRGDVAASTLRAALVKFQDAYARIHAHDLWHDQAARFYSLDLDQNVLALVRNVTHSGAPPVFTGAWCGSDLRLEIRSEEHTS